MSSDIGFRPFDSSRDVVGVCALMWEFWREVMQEDLDGKIDVTLLSGETVNLDRVEAELYSLIHQNREFQIAECDGNIIGIMCFIRIFDNTIAIRQSFVMPEFEGLGVAAGLINTVSGEPTTILFQTRKAHKPVRALSVTKEHRKLISEDENFKTWAMTWNRR